MSVNNILSVIVLSAIIIINIPQINAYKPYFAPSKIGTWQAAQAYCQISCNSDLVSIHNYYEYLDLRFYLQFYSSINPNISIWIGLNNYNQTSTNYTYIDSSIFDYQTNLSSYPWNLATNTYNENCVAIDPQNDWKWNNKDCTDDSDLIQFVCNYCYEGESTNALHPNDPDHAYYISDTRDNIWYASEFCNGFCEADIVSFHSEDDHNFAKLMADNHRRINIYDPKWQTNDIWIGLADMYGANSMFWLDNTPFNYGNDYRFTEGDGPWAIGQPTKNQNFDGTILGDLVVQMNVSQDYKWMEVSPAIESFAMCSKCDSRINKYILIKNFTMNFQEAEAFCVDNIGTHLASLHSDDDREQLLFAVQHTGL